MQLKMVDDVVVVGEGEGGRELLIAVAWLAAYCAPTAIAASLSSSLQKVPGVVDSCYSMLIALSPLSKICNFIENNFKNIKK